MPSNLPAFASVFAFQPSSACDLDRLAKCLCDEMASLAMIGCVPVLRLMLELQHRGPPTNTCARSRWTAISGRSHAGDLLHRHSPIMLA
jgi:hypothetical protein